MENEMSSIMQCAILEAFNTAIWVEGIKRICGNFDNCGSKCKNADMVIALVIIQGE